MPPLEGPLDGDERARYARQVRLPQLGLAGQERLKAASVLVVGAGGLGSPAATYLAAAGVGTLGIADGDTVDISNLHRQPLHGTKDIGRPKVQSALDTLTALNPHAGVEAIPHRITSANALEIVSRFDIVIDGTDNFPTRYLLNDACVLTSRPLVYGSVDRFDGQVSVFATSSGPCYRCLYPRPPEPGTVQNCADAGVLGVLPGIVGTMQATEAIKIILGLGETLIGRLLLVDALRMRFRTVTVDRDPECPACGTRKITALIDYDAFCAGSSAVTGPLATVTPRALSDELKGGHAITLIDVREPYEWNYARIEGARLVPLGTIEASLSTVDPNADVVVYCHHGMRSEMAGYALRDAGVKRVRNLVGGIDRWSVEVDPAVPRY
jgi:sulfur-carrier protein adenylyltransferase/sulfurtransferase